MNEKSYTDQIQLAKLVNSVTDIGVLLFHNKKIVLDLCTKHTGKNRIVKTIPRMIPDSSFTGIQVFEIDSYTRFICVNIPCSEKLNSQLFIGPFLIKTKKSSHNLYKSNHIANRDLKILSEDKLKNIKRLIFNLVYNPFHITSAQDEQTKKIRPFTDSQIFNSKIEKGNSFPDFEINNKDIYSVEIRYQEQAKLKHAIIKGDIEQCKKLVEYFEDFSLLFTDRIDNVLRLWKNMSIVGNTSGRLFAEEAGVHPFCLDYISKKYFIQIEACKNISDLKILNKEMIFDYCLLVKRFSNTYSPTVKKIIDYIYVNINQPVSLNKLAEHLNLNKSYLCKIFKKETNKTITCFSNHMKVEEGKYLLLNSDLKISDISLLLGYNNVCYFCRIFKKETGSTPTNFRLERRQQLINESK